MKPRNPRWDLLPTPLHQRRHYGIGRLHVHNTTLEMAINRDVVTRLGWRKGDQVVYRIDGEELRVRRMQL